MLKRMQKKKKNIYGETLYICEKKNVFVTKNDKMHTKYTMGNERALPETCIISAFELLRYQNVKRYQWKKKKKTLPKTCVLCVLHIIRCQKAKKKTGKIGYSWERK